MPPQVENAALDSGGGEHGPVECRGERRPLAAGGDIAASEVRDRGDAGAPGDDVRIAELHRERRRRARCVMDRLAVAADRRHVAGIGPGGLDEIERGAREHRPDPRIRVPETDRGGVRVLRQGVELVLQIAGDGRRVRGDDGRAAVEVDERGVHRVHAGSGDQTDEERHLAICLDILSRVDLDTRSNVFEAGFQMNGYEAATGPRRPGGSRRKETPCTPCRFETQPRQSDSDGPNASPYRRIPGACARAPSAIGVLSPRSSRPAPPPRSGS